MSIDYETSDARYVEAIGRELAGIVSVSVGCLPDRLCGECNVPDDEWDDEETRQAYDEGSFRPGPCDSCGSTYAGSYFDAHGWMTLDNGREIIVHLDICGDCLQFHANGDTPGESFQEWHDSPESYRDAEDTRRGITSDDVSFIPR